MKICGWGSSPNSRGPDTKAMRSPLGEKTTPWRKHGDLKVKPPSGWFNVPIQSDDVRLRGCQMMRTGQNEELLGMPRVLSVRLPVTKESPPWFDTLVSMEAKLIAQMGYNLTEVIWKRDSVPISGPGFKNARAIGLKATIEGNDVPQEAHFLVFENDEAKFIVTLLTPSKSVEDSIHYKRNTSDFGVLIRNFKRKK